MIKCGWIFFGSFLGVLGIRQEGCARSLRSWFGLGKTPATQTSVSKEKEAPEQTASKPISSPEKETRPAPRTVLPRSDSPQLSSPAFMMPPNALGNSWQSYSEGATSLALQGLIYVRDDQWTVWLNGSVLLPTLRSLSVGEQTVCITTVTPRSVTIQCPDETITLTVGQIYDLKTHQLSTR